MKPHVAKVFQGQDVVTLGGTIDRNEPDAARKSCSTWLSSIDNDKDDTVSNNVPLKSENCMTFALPEPIFRDLLSGLGTEDAINSVQKSIHKGEEGMNALRGAWNVMHFSSSLGMSEPNLKINMPSELSCQTSSKTSFGGRYSLAQTLDVDNQTRNWLMPMVPQSGTEDVSCLGKIVQQPNLTTHDGVENGNGSCKLFGIHLKSAIQADALQPSAPAHLDADKQLKDWKDSKLVEKIVTPVEQEKPHFSSHDFSKEGQVKPKCGGSVRSCVKVF